MRLGIAACAAAAALAALAPVAPAAASGPRPAHPQAAQHRAVQHRAARQLAAGPSTPIRHFIFLMQGGRTFDNYFGSYPGADGPPAGTCQGRVQGRPQDGCVRPFPLVGRQPPPLGASRTTITGQYNDGKMNGFVSAYQRQGRNGTPVMGYYDQRQLRFYWNAARSYVLFDHFFSAAQYGIRANRSYWVSAATAPGGKGAIPAGGYGRQRTIFDRLQQAGVSWKFYVQDYRPGDTYQTASAANLETQTSRVPLVDYRRFIRDPALARHIVGLSRYYKDLTAGTLPAVAYIASSSGDNERSARTIAAGQSLVRNLVTQLMQSRYWDSSALLWSYDGSGGWFDHVPPPRVGSAVLGFRVPALLISAYARKGSIDHTVLDYTSALRFIEQNWRLAPLTARDAQAQSLSGAFDFAAGPRPPALISPGSSELSGGVPAAFLPPPTPIVTIYLLYGAAAAAGLVLLLAAAFWPAWSARRQALAASRAAEQGGAST
jgi:phospholipase C